MAVGRTGARAVLLALLVTLGLVLAPAGTGATPLTQGVTQGATQGAVAGAKPKPAPKPKWTPAKGVIFNDPTIYGRRRVVLTPVVRAINATKKGQQIRIAVWNLDDRPVATALVRAKARGAIVQVVVAGFVENPNWTRVARALNKNTRDDSFARRCTGGCRSRAKIMHSKVFLFSKVNSARTISMIGSSNLTTPAGNRQWNDTVVSHNKPLYDYLVGIFAEYARDKPVKDVYRVDKIGNARVTLFPAGNRNPVLAELDKVRCKGATGGTGTAAGRTRVRIAVAGWFDAYGGAIAQRVRQMWDRGCDVKIITTLAGRGVNQMMKATSGRGRVPMRELSVDRNADGIPERYLHMKALTISGVYDGDTAASVVFTGSPNWSTRAQRSEEIWLRLVERPGMVTKYTRHIDRLYSSRWASARVSTPAELARAVALAKGTTLGRVKAGQDLPEWLELD